MLKAAHTAVGKGRPFLTELQEKLNNRQALIFHAEKRASVAVILRQRPPFTSSSAEGIAPSPLRHLDMDRTEVLYIKRATHPNDLWSGHVSFPGGKRDKGETDYEAAVRECYEETGLNLESSDFTFLGRLNDRPVYAKGRKQGGFAMCSFVFLQTSERTPSVKLNTDEVAGVRWVPVERLRKDFVAPRGVEMPFRMLPLPGLLKTLLGLDRVYCPSILLPEEAAWPVQAAEEQREVLETLVKDEHMGLLGGLAGMGMHTSAAARARQAEESAAGEPVAEAGASQRRRKSIAGVASAAPFSSAAGAAALSSVSPSSPETSGLSAAPTASSSLASSATGTPAAAAEMTENGGPAGLKQRMYAAAAPSASSSPSFSSPLQYQLWGLTLHVTSDMLGLMGYQRASWPPMTFRSPIINSLIYASCGLLELKELLVHREGSLYSLTPKHMAFTFLYTLLPTLALYNWLLA